MFTYGVLLLYLLTLFHLLFLKSTVIVGYSSCLDENNNPIDWFVIYKLPKIKGHSNPLIGAGVAYTFISPENENGWILSSKSINDSNSIPGLTLASLYQSSSQESLYILYNDQPPVGNATFTGGHTKGVVFAQKSGGFWLIHSVPHYPPIPKVDQYSYPNTGLKNGQSYLCVTIPDNQMDLVGTQLMYNDPHIFVNSTPADLQKQYPNLTKAALGSDVKTPPWYHTEPLTSFAGKTFQTFAKAPEFNKDLYSDWVVTVLQVNLLVETWPNGPGRLNSSCHRPFRVENVDGVNISVVGQSFSSHKDHSKWAISETKTDPWVCIGDINRAMSQSSRGGGTVCLKDELLWQAYLSSVSSIESCP